MNFLGLTFLFALPLLAVPVIIHLYRGRQREVVAWGAMQFLVKATTKGRNMQRLEELLLMLLRVGILAALVLALAQPEVTSSWFGTESDREVVLLLDNSLSMARSIDGQSAFDRMIEQSTAAVDDLSAGDMVHVMLAAGGGRWLTANGIAANSEGKRQLKSLIEKLRPTLGDAKLLDCLQTVATMDAHQQRAARRIVVFTDNQLQSWQLEADSTWRQLAESSNDPSLPTTIEVVACELEASGTNNLAVMTVEASRQFVQPEELVDVRADITNFGDDASSETIVEWLADERVIATSMLRELTPRESAQVTAQFQNDESAVVAVSARIKSDDQVKLDDQGSVVVEVADEVPILLVHDFEETNEYAKTAADLFMAALGYRGTRAQPWHSVYRPELITTDELADKSLADYRAVVLLGLSEIPAAAHERLQSFVRRGGGLWVALGEMVDRDVFNRHWYDDGGGLSPISLESLVHVPDTNQPEGTIHPPEKSHPATFQLANTTQLDIDQARLTDYWRFVKRGAQDEAAWALLETGDGSPLVVESLVGDGRVLVQAFPLGLTWTNLPQLKSYVVMVHDWLDYLTAPATARFNLQPGNAITASLPSTADVSSAELITPNGQQVQLAIAGGEDHNLIRYSQTQLPGLYRVRASVGSDETNLPFYVSREASESNLEYLTDEQRGQLASTSGVQFEGLEAAPTTVEEIEPRPRTEPIWGMLLAALVALLVLELLMSGWLARQRSGTAVAT